MQWTYREKRNDQEQWCTLGGGVWDVNARLSECLVTSYNNNLEIYFILI